jgi:hypothetical protein
MSGQSHTFGFSPTTTIGHLKDLVWGEWPAGESDRSLSFLGLYKSLVLIQVVLVLYFSVIVMVWHVG